MRRKSKGPRRYSNLNDIKNDLPTEQLAGIGAVSLAWNELESGIDFLLATSLKLATPMHLEVTSRINGFDGKIALIKAALKKVWQVPEDSCAVIADTFGAIEVYKRYRDGVVHALIVSRDSAVAQTAQRRGALDEILVTVDALDALYARIIAADREVFLILKAVMVLHLPEMGAKKFKLGEIPESITVSAWEGAMEYITELKELQSKRKALGTLPAFPESQTA